MADADRPFYGLERGRLVIVLGPPGTGKSSLLGSVADVIDPMRVELLCTKANEANSFLYRKHGLSARAEIFTDPNWDPDLGVKEATGFNELRKHIRELRGVPDIDAVLIDSGTDAIRLLENRTLASLDMASIGDLRGKGAKDASFGFYDQLLDRGQKFMEGLIELTLPPHPKFVLMTWHSRAASESDEETKGIDHEGSVLPMMRGQYRKKLMGDADAVLFTDIRRRLEPAQLAKPALNGQPAQPAIPAKQVVEYVVRVTPSASEHAKVRSISSVGAPEFIPNTFAAWLELERKAVE
jgi:hypothetical protein